MPPLRSTRKSEARRCSEVMRDIVGAYRGRLEEELRGTGVTLPQLRMLKAINQQAEGSAAAIARHVHITPQTLHAMLTRATREGWITRGSSTRNSRFVTASLTDKGRAILQHGLDLVERIEEDVWRGVPLERIKTTRKSLEAGLANLQPEPRDD